MATTAFLIPNLGASNNFEDYIVTVNTIETLVGLDFLSSLNDFYENTIES